jgi:hypothetical protein
MMKLKDSRTIMHAVECGAFARAAVVAGSSAPPATDSDMESS